MSLPAGRLVMRPGRSSRAAGSASNGGLCSAGLRGGRSAGMTQARLKHFGWGREGEGLTAEEEAATLDRYRRLFDVEHFDEVTPPPISEIELRRPRVLPLGSLAPGCSGGASAGCVLHRGKPF